MVMETYAERLEREKKEKMTNYDFDEMKRQEKAKVERNLASADYDGCLGQTDIPSVNPKWNERRSDEDMTERMKTGVLQANGTLEVEPTFNVKHVAESVLHIANLPLDTNVPFITIMATKMPYIGRG